MRKILGLSLVLTLLATHSVSAKVLLLDENAQTTSRALNSQQLFSEKKTMGSGTISTHPHNLAAVAQETLTWLNTHPEAPIQGSVLESYGVTRADVLKTLRLIITTVKEDQIAGRKSRLENSDWLEKNFRMIQWAADNSGAKANNVKVPDQRLRITKYVVFYAQGKTQPSRHHCCALYAIPDEERHLKETEAETKKQALLRYRFTKQQVIKGALKGKMVRPLVWLTRQGLEDALMQGSILVKMPDGKQRMFNVHRNNGISYDRKIKNPKQQRRYWYFKEVKGILGYGKEDKILVKPEVTFAGDVYNIGLGKLIAIRYPQNNGHAFRLGVLADTGGAFVPNLYQLDYLAGVFPTREAYQKGVAGLPSFAQTFVLIAK